MKTKSNRYNKRKTRTRIKVRGTISVPRLVVYRSNKALSAQIVDDESGHTLVTKTVRGTTIKIAKLLGAEIANVCKTKKIHKLVFDRGGYRYHGAVKQIAESAREGGLII